MKMHWKQTYLLPNTEVFQRTARKRTYSFATVQKTGNQRKKALITFMLNSVMFGVVLFFCE